MDAPGILGFSAERYRNAGVQNGQNVATITQFGHARKKSENVGRVLELHYRIAEVARILHISRASVYNLLRGARIVDLGGKGKRGVKLVPESVLRAILDRKTKTLR